MVGSINKTIVMFPLQLEICDRTVINREICIRWYPDNCQIIPHVSDTNELEKSSALDKFLKEGTKLKLLPDYISLYTYGKIKDGKSNDILGEEELYPLVKDIKINPKDPDSDLILHPLSEWISDFNKAVENGMGIRITDPAKCAQLDEAKWLIVVGYKDSVKNEEILRELFVNNKALGRLEILRQDTPTNNTESSISAYSSDIGSIPNVQSTNLGIDTEINGCNLLSIVFGVNTEMLKDVNNSTLIEQRAAIAMSRLLWNACTTEYYHNYMNYAVPSGKGNNPDLKDVYSADMDRYLWPLIRRHFETYVIGRGPVPSLRINNNPYGILPVTNLTGWKSLEPDENSYKYKLDNAMAIILSALKKKLLAVSAKKWDQGNIKEDGQFEHLVQVLQLNPVSNSASATLNSEKPKVPPGTNTITIGQDSFPILEPPIGLCEDDFLFCWDDVQNLDTTTKNDISENNSRLIASLKQMYGKGWGWPILKDYLEYYSDYINKDSEKKILLVGWITNHTILEDESGSKDPLEPKIAVKLELKDEYLFNWDEISRNDNENKRLVEFLKKSYCLDWVREENIEKDGNIIVVSAENTHLCLKINDDMTIINVIIDDKISAELVAKEENGKINVYYDKVNLELYDYWASQNGQNPPYINIYELIAKRENGKLNIYSNNDRYTTINETMRYYTLIANAQYPNTRLNTLEIRERLLNKKEIMPLLQRLLLYSAMVLEDELKSLAEEYVFNWDDIPEKDNGKLIEYITQKYTPDFENAKIDRFSDDNIVISTELHRISLKLNYETTEVSLEFGSYEKGNLCVRFKDKLIAKRESGKLKIYTEGTIKLDSSIDFYTVNFVGVNYQYQKWGQYPAIDLFGERHVPLLTNGSPIWQSHVDKLAKLVADNNDKNNLKTKTGEKLHLGQGYSLQIKKAEANGKNVWLEFDKDGQYIDHTVITTDSGDYTWTSTLNKIQGENNIPVLKVHVNRVSQNEVEIDGLWLIDYANTMILKIGDEFEESTIVKIITGVFESSLGSLVFKNNFVLPVAAFSAYPRQGKAPLTVKFTDASTGSPTLWYWEFGDESTSAQQNPIHTYSSKGTYAVTLIVQNATGTDSMTMYIKVA